MAAIGCFLSIGSADAQPVLSVADTACVEGDAGWHPMVFVVRLSGPTVDRVRFHYQTVDGTATASDGDYQPVSGDLEITQGQSSAVIEVPIQGDSLLEGNERFSLLISNLENAIAGDTVAVGTILNDERNLFVRFASNVPEFGPGTLPPCWGDIDGDGRPDLPMYLNLGGVFMEASGFRSLLGDGNYHGGAWCDYDRDGDMDLVLMPYGDDESSFNYTRLLKNTPFGFLDVGSVVNVDVAGHGETPVWGDFDGDGWPDLFLPFYSFEFPYRSYFYRNAGDGTFTETAVASGVSLSNIPIELRPEGATAADWNDDGALDLYVASHLFLNDGDAHFTDVRASVGLPAMYDEGAQFVDYDDDGDLDLYVRTANGPTLYRNDGGTFVDVTASLGLGFVDWEWGDRWCDIDMDGDLDLVWFDAAGFARLLRNNGNGTFSSDSSFDLANLSGSLCAFADVDGDGDPDIVVGAYKKQFARNKLELVPRSHTPYFKVRVEDDQGRWVEQGATVKLRSLDDPRHPIQTRVVDGGSGYLGQDEYTLTFGGVGSGRFDLEVDFPSKPSARVVVGPAQNPLLGGIRPGEDPPTLYIVHPGNQVLIQDLPQAVSAVTPLASMIPRLRPIAPNPARERAVVGYTLPRPGSTSIAVFDPGGRRVRTLCEGARPAGPGDASWDLRDDSGRPVRPGLYFIRLALDGMALGTQRLAVLR